MPDKKRDDAAAAMRAFRIDAGAAYTCLIKLSGVWGYTLWRDYRCIGGEMQIGWTEAQAREAATQALAVASQVN